MAALAETPDEKPIDEPGSSGELWSAGRRLGGRYRLERLVRGFGGAHRPEPQLWVGVDELLNRKVGVELIATDHPLAEEVAGAARVAAAVPDARFVQVLDAVQEPDVLYIVTEWVPAAEQLQERLAPGPMSPMQATAMARELAEAMVRAHEVEVAHGALNPTTVLITAVGQVKLRGLLVEATLGGLSPDALAPEERYAADVLAIGQIWYAALTGRWPGEQADFGLQAAPHDGPVPYAPLQIRASVPKQVDSLVCRALGIGDPDARITSVKHLADAIRSLPRMREEAPEPTSVLPRSRAREAAPAYPLGGAQDADARPTTWTPRVEAGRPNRPAWRRPGVLAAVGCAVLALATVAAFQLSGNDANANGDQANGNTPGGTSSPRTLTISPGTVGSPLNPSGATVWDNDASLASINAAPAAIDPSSTTGWRTTTQYKNASFSGSFTNGSGIGLIIDLGAAHDVDEVKFQVPFSGGSVEVLTANSGASGSPSWSSTAGPTGYSVSQTAQSTTAGGDITWKFSQVTTQYVMLLFTSLPYQQGDTSSGTPSGYRDGLINVRVYGA